jgi:hypothetical protein
VGEATGHAPGGSKENVTYIVEVSWYSPEATAE